MPEIPFIKVDRIDLPILSERGINLQVARLDLIHPVVSGNKLFKLHYFLDSSQQIHDTRVVTAGGAFSNHLVATAFACREKNIAAAGIVRGEKPTFLNATLSECLEYGMELHFISRHAFSELREEKGRQWLKEKFGSHVFIPEGGCHPLGAAGASMIPSLFRDIEYTHLCCATGTGTTLAGIANSAYTPNRKIIGFSAIKGMHDIRERFEKLGVPYNDAKIKMADEYHFGGYAAHTPELLLFMNNLFRETGIPLDFVYTGKMMFGIMDMIKKEQFPEGSQILCMHTGGLQGNRSLKPGSLHYSR